MYYYVGEILAASIVCSLLSRIIIPGTKLKDFVTTMQSEADIQSEIAKLRHEVEEYAKKFPTIGFEKETMRHKD